MDLLRRYVLLSALGFASLLGCTADAPGGDGAADPGDGSGRADGVTNQLLGTFATGGPATPPPVCDFVGTAAEGWYHPDTGEIICAAACAEATPRRAATSAPAARDTTPTVTAAATTAGSSTGPPVTSDRPTSR